MTYTIYLDVYKKDDKKLILKNYHYTTWSKENIPKVGDVIMKNGIFYEIIKKVVKNFSKAEIRQIKMKKILKYEN